MDLGSKRGPGRPKKESPVEFTDLSDDEKVLRTYLDGGFDASVCKAIEISKEEFDERCKSNPKFARLVSFGRTICEAWWDEKFKEAANGNSRLNASMINFWMKNKFGWAEKSETTARDMLSIEGLSRDEALQKLRDYGPNIIDLLEARKRS